MLRFGEDFGGDETTAVGLEAATGGVTGLVGIGGVGTAVAAGAVGSGRSVGVEGRLETVVRGAGFVSVSDIRTSLSISSMTASSLRFCG